MSSASLYKPLSSLQHAERRWAQFDTAIRRGKEIHISVWKKHLEILLYCWVIWKLSPPPLQRLILAVRFGVLATQFGVSPRVRVPNSRRRKGEGGCGLGCPLAGFPPKHKELVFWLFLLSYMTSGPFSWWYFLLLTQSFFWYFLAVRWWLISAV